MDNNEYKIGTEMRLALDVDYETRIRTLDLNVGYNSTRFWELIVKYTGDIRKIALEMGFSYIELLGRFAIIKIREIDINRLIKYSEILYVDKPKQMYLQQFDIVDGCKQSCMNMNYIDLFGNDIGLTGKDVLVAILDSGIDFHNPLFQKDDGKSRILYFWDQTGNGNAPLIYNFGTEYDNESINQMKSLKNYDESGHGTAVASIVASCATEASFVVVKLGQDILDECNTISLICAIDYVIRIAIKLQMPLVINISYGNYYGDHAGNSILEKYIDAVITETKLSIVVGTGNEGNTGRHARIKASDYKTYQVSFRVDAYETAINMQIWYNFFDDIRFSIITPEGIKLGPFKQSPTKDTYQMFDMSIVSISGIPTLINDKREEYIAFIPNNTYIMPGVYTILIDSQEIIDGTVDFWLPEANSTNSNVSFLNPDPEITLTIPSSAQSVISVGAYDIRTERYANFSGRGFDSNGRVKPDLCAPGVQIRITNVNGSFSYISGTSFATPYVTAAASMLMQWGIVDGNDPFLYGPKLKQYLIKGARPLLGETVIPNSKTGYGALCLKNSLKL